MTITTFLGSLLAAMALGIPIAFSLLLCGAALMWHLNMFDAQILAQNVIESANSFPLLAVPFFMLAGEVMNAGGLSRRIVNFALTHEVHNLRMLCGDIMAVQAFASNATRGFPVEDTVAINLRFSSGVLGTFLLSDTAACARSWEQTSQENKAYPSYDDEDCYVITGTDGSLSVPTMRLKSYPRAEDRSWWKAFELDSVALIRDDPIRLQMAHFGEVVRGETEPRVTALDGLLNLRVTEAISTAALEGCVIELATS